MFSAHFGVCALFQLRFRQYHIVRIVVMRKLQQQLWGSCCLETSVLDVSIDIKYRVQRLKKP